MTLSHGRVPGNRALLALLCLALPAGAQMAWRRHTPAQAPLARWLHAMAHDAARGRTLLFGGWDGGLTTVLPDQWEWDGHTWTRQMPTPIPSARCGHVMAFDSVRGRVLLFGGRGVATLGDTWEWDGVAWQRLAPALSPSPRWTPALAYDPVNRNHVLFGGWDEAAQAPSDETWTWDGSTWTPRTLPVRPRARFYHALAADRWRGRVVLFGGVDPGPPAVYLGDTWEWDGAAWNEIQPGSAPPPTARHAMAYDKARGRVVLHGGNEDGWALQRDTWEWDGTLWHRRTLSPPLPPPGACPALAYESGSRGLLLFGGLAAVPMAHGETWEYHNLAPATFDSFGLGCPPSAELLLEPLPGTLPWIGERFTIRSEPLAPGAAALGFLGISDASWGGLPLPMGLGLFGFPACRVLVSGDLALVLPVFGGVAELLLPIPVDPTLPGLAFFAQVFALHSGRLYASPGGRAVVGRK